MMTKSLEVGRLALRAEGENWNAYYAKPNTMEDAIFLGSIRMEAVIDYPDRKMMFMKLMQEVITDIIEEAFDQRPTWNSPRNAPENEKAGNV